jgi:putative ABC transport system substrate-binding protein
MTTRRSALAALGGTLLLLLPRRSSAQPKAAQARAKVWRVGFLVSRARAADSDANDYAAFVSGMRELGYVEGQNLAIEWRYADGKAELLPQLASELVQLKVDLIATSSTPAILAVQKATSTIPIVMANVTDPVGSGFVKSLAKPGGNITGLSSLGPDVIPKHLELLLSISPRLSHVALLSGPANTGNTAVAKSLDAAARKAGVRVLPVEARTSKELELAFGTIAREKAAAVIVSAHPFFTENARQIAQLAARYRLPSIYPWRQYADAGGLMSYGQNLQEFFRRAAIYVDKIFKGARPGDLPVEQSTRLELVINRRTAAALGLSIPQDLLLRADTVIE